MHIRVAVTVLLILVCSPSAADAVTEHDVRFRSDVELAAALLLPGGDAPVAAAVIVHGSGPSHRENAWARTIADLFVAEGIAVLLPDKRGSGKSGGDWQVAGFEELAADALAGVDFLKSRKEVDPSRIGLVGLSQGGWIVPLAAARRPDVAFVVNLSGATVSVAEQSFVEMTNTARQAGLDDDAIAIVIEVNRAAGRYLLGGAWAEYARIREAASKGAAQKIVAGFPGSPDAKIWTFLRKVAAFDPIPYWSIVEQPVFIGYGALDESDNVPVNESVRRVEWAFGRAQKKAYEIVVVPGVGHALWNAEHELATMLVQRLKSWLHAQSISTQRAT